MSPTKQANGNKCGKGDSGTKTPSGTSLSQASTHSKVFLFFFFRKTKQIEQKGKRSGADETVFESGDGGVVPPAGNSPG